MMNFEQALGQSATLTPAAGGNAPSDRLGLAPTETFTIKDTPVSGASRVLEMAALTADRLVAEAQAEAESLVTTAQSRADAIAASSRDEADRIAAALAAEKAAIEAEIATLRQRARDHRNQMRHHLTEQLALLDPGATEPPILLHG